MQVIFTNVVLGAQQAQPSDGRHISLIFQIEFRGKSYNCVGHLKQFSKQASQDNPVQFTGYYGYNGPIDIESLRSAVVDYYESVINAQETRPRRVKIDLGGPEAVAAEKPEQSTPAAWSSEMTRCPRGPSGNAEANETVLPNRDSVMATLASAPAA